MAIRILPFGAFAGFSDLGVAGASYYTQGLTQSANGIATQYSIQNKIDSGTVSGMGNIKGYAIGPGGALFAQDDAGNILKETTPGAYDFAIVRSPLGNGAGILGDQYGNLLYACGSTNTALGKYDGTTWNDSYQSLNTAQHPMDTYEDLRLIANLNTLAVIFSDGSFNNDAFPLPDQMRITAVKGGPTGILMGANLGYRGAVILWDGIADDAKTPWKWEKGQILSIETYGENWIVKTTREVFLTNGYTKTTLFTVFDDQMSFKSFDNTDVLPQQMVVVNDTIVFANVNRANGPLSYEFGRAKPGVYLYHISRKAWDYLPLPTGNTVTVAVTSVFADVNYNNRILIGYRDETLGKNYIANLSDTPPTTAIYISEELGIGRPHYQRVYFGPTEKVALAAILNLGILSSIVDPATLSLNVALKIYNFKRQLWGKSITNAALGSSHKNELQVDGTSSSNTKAQTGDEVTILDGVNAGLIAHISSIANQGLSNETWTLDTTFPNATESGIYVNVQPWKLVQKKTYANLTELKHIFFDIKNSIRAKQFLLKVAIDGLGTNLQVELQTSYFVFDDLGWQQSA